MERVLSQDAITLVGLLGIAGSIHIKLARLNDVEM